MKVRSLKNPNTLKRAVSWEDVVRQGFHTRIDGQPDSALVDTVVPYLEQKWGDMKGTDFLKVLEVGALDGRNALYLGKQEFLDLSAIDLDTIPQFEKFRYKVVQDELPIKTGIIEKGGKLLFKDGSIDVVCLFRVLHLLIDPTDRMDLIQKCWKALKIGGLLIFSVKNNINDVLDGFLLNDALGVKGTRLAKRDMFDITQLYYGGLLGVLEDIERFEICQKSIGQTVRSRLIETLTFEMNDEKEYRGEKVFDTPCIHVAFEKQV